MRLRFTLGHRVAAALLGMAAGAGCSTSRYDADYARRLEEYRFAAAFAAVNSQATTLPGTRVSLRLPRQMFTPVADESKSRLAPPFLREFPGRVATYEVMCEAAGAKWPASLTIGVVPRAERQVADIEKSILTQVRSDEAFPTVAFRTGVGIQPVAGGPATWHVLSLAGSQLFDVEVAGNSDAKRSAGQCEVWVSADPKQEFCTILAIRVPNDVFDQLLAPPSELIELVARTVEVAPADASRP